MSAHHKTLIIDRHILKLHIYFQTSFDNVGLNRCFARDEIKKVWNNQQIYYISNVLHQINKKDTSKYSILHRS